MLSSIGISSWFSRCTLRVMHRDEIGSIVNVDYFDHIKYVASQSPLEFCPAMKEGSP